MLWQLTNFTKHPELLGYVSDGDEFIACKFFRETWGKVFEGKRNLCVVDSNVVNCEFPPGTKFSGCKPVENEYDIEVFNIKGLEHRIPKYRNTIKVPKCKEMVNNERVDFFATRKFTDKKVLKDYSKEIEKSKKELEPKVIKNKIPMR